MTTLATLKAEIASDLDRTDMTSQIASAIARAIHHFQDQELWWTPTRDLTFNTVAAQTTYGVADNADIANIVLIRAVFALISDNYTQMSLMPWAEWEELADNTSSTGQPWGFAWQAEQFYLYPIPNDVYEIRVHAHLKTAEPATDDETGNRWMTDGYDLIRAAAKRILAVHTLRDYELAGIMEREAMAAFNRLARESDRKTDAGGGMITGIQF